MEAPAYIPASDGLPARVSGEWAKRKHHYLGNYCGITTKSMRRKFRMVYLDVMAGPGKCIVEETKEEFSGSPLIALKHEFAEYILIEEDQALAKALNSRISEHPKASMVRVIPENWVKVVRDGRLRFDDRTLVVVFVDPTGISQVPMTAMQAFVRNTRIDLLVTIQYRLGIVWNTPQYFRSSNETSLDAFLGNDDWRKWDWRDASEFGRLSIEKFSMNMQKEGFILGRHVPVPERNPLYRFTLFSRHPRGEDFWNKVLKIDEKGQRELL